MASDNGSLVKKVLVVRPDALGDAILSIPFINSVKKTFPNGSISVLIHPMNEALFKAVPSVDECILDWQSSRSKTLFPSKQYVSFIKESQFEYCFLLYSDLFYATLAYRANIPIRVGDGDRVFLRLLFTHPVSQSVRDFTQHVVEQNLSFLTAIVPEARLSLLPQLQSSEKTRALMNDRLTALGIDLKKPLIGIHPFTGGHNRVWLFDRYLCFMSTCLEAGYQVILTGAGDVEIKKSQQIIEALDQKVVSLAGKTTLPELMSAIELCDVFVGTDTGPLHMAAALSVPVLCLSPTKFVKSMHWGPWGSINRVVQDTRLCSYSCNPMRCKRPNCLEGISVAHVFKVLTDLLSVERKPMIDRSTWFKSSMTIAFFCTDLTETTEQLLCSYVSLSNQAGLSFWIAVSKMKDYQRLCELMPGDALKIRYLPIYNPISWYRFCIAEDVTIFHSFTIFDSFNIYSNGSNEVFNNK